MTIIKDSGFTERTYKKSKDVIILFTAFERDDNSKFVSNITSALKRLDGKGKKITPKNLSIESKYSIKEIELNLHEITSIMDAIGID